MSARLEGVSSRVMALESLPPGLPLEGKRLEVDQMWQEWKQETGERRSQVEQAERKQEIENQAIYDRVRDILDHMGHDFMHLRSEFKGLSGIQKVANLSQNQMRIVRKIFPEEICDVLEIEGSFLQESEIVQREQWIHAYLMNLPWEKLSKTLLKICEWNVGKEVDGPQSGVSPVPKLRLEMGEQEADVLPYPSVLLHPLFTLEQLMQARPSFRVPQGIDQTLEAILGNLIGIEMQTDPAFQWDSPTSLLEKLSVLDRPYDQAIQYLYDRVNHQLRQFCSCEFFITMMHLFYGIQVNSVLYTSKMIRYFKLRQQLQQLFSEREKLEGKLKKLHEGNISQIVVRLYSTIRGDIEELVPRMQKVPDFSDELVQKLEEDYKKASCIDDWPRVAQKIIALDTAFYQCKNIVNQYLNDRTDFLFKMQTKTKKILKSISDTRKIYEEHPFLVQMQSNLEKMFRHLSLLFFSLNHEEQQETIDQIIQQIEESRHLIASCELVDLKELLSQCEKYFSKMEKRVRLLMQKYEQIALNQPYSMIQKSLNQMQESLNALHADHDSTQVPIILHEMLKIVNDVGDRTAHSCKELFNVMDSLATRLTGNISTIVQYGDKFDREGQIRDQLQKEIASMQNISVDPEHAIITYLRSFNQRIEEIESLLEEFKNAFDWVAVTQETNNLDKINRLIKNKAGQIQSLLQNEIGLFLRKHQEYIVKYPKHDPERLEELIEEGVSWEVYALLSPEHERGSYRACRIIYEKLKELIPSSYFKYLISLIFPSPLDTSDESIYVQMVILLGEYAYRRIHSKLYMEIDQSSFPYCSWPKLQQLFKALLTDEEEQARWKNFGLLPQEIAEGLVTANHSLSDYVDYIPSEKMRAVFQEVGVFLKSTFWK